MFPYRKSEECERVGKRVWKKVWRRGWKTKITRTKRKKKEFSQEPPRKFIAKLLYKWEKKKYEK